MSKPTPDAIRRALQECLNATATVDTIHDAEPPDDAPASAYEAWEAAADTAVGTEGRCRAALRELVGEFVEALPCVVEVDGMLVVITDHADCMAVVPAGQVVRL
jgi:hypothetical protein